jgi:hypothetical protein
MRVKGSVLMDVLPHPIAIHTDVGHACHSTDAVDAKITRGVGKLHGSFVVIIRKHGGRRFKLRMLLDLISLLLALLLAGSTAEDAHISANVCGGLEAIPVVSCGSHLEFTFECAVSC